MSCFGIKSQRQLSESRFPEKDRLFRKSSLYERRSNAVESSVFHLREANMLEVKTCEIIFRMSMHQTMSADIVAFADSYDFAKHSNFHSQWLSLPRVANDLQLLG